MNFARQIASIVLSACMAMVVTGCQPSDPASPKVASVESIALAPASATIEIGAVQSLQVIATYSDGSSFDVSSASTFVSSAPGVASVDAGTGYVTAVTAGSATITATHTPSGRKATMTVTVSPLRVLSIAVAPSPLGLTVGGSQALVVTGSFNNATTGDVTAGSTFVSSNTAAATVNAAGLVQAVATGTSTITVTHTASGATATVDVTVTSGSSGGFTPITFDKAGVTYTLTGFGGAEDATVVTDPTGGSNLVARVVKSATAELWAGTTISTGANLTIERIPFAAGSTKMSVRVYSPRAGIPVRLKVEDAADGTHTVETEATTTVANAWETLVFDFSNPASGTPSLNLAYTYNRISIFFDFGTTGAAGGGGTFYLDDVVFGTGNSFVPITFSDAGVTYTLTGFGGAEDATVVSDPSGGSNLVARVVKSATAELWAGTTISTGANLTIERIPFAAGSTKMSVRVYSPRAGIPVRLKVEDAADGSHSVETEAITTVANAWETLVFDFSNPATGTPSLNLAYTYNRISIFFDFGTTGAAGGGGTFYFDDVSFGAPATGPLVFASGYASNNRTVEGGEWGFYSGNFTNYSNTYTGGGFVDGPGAVPAADSYIYLVVATSAPSTDGYMGIFTAAPGSTIAAPTAGVTLGGQTQLKIELAMGAEWYQQAGSKSWTVRLVGAQVYSDGAGGSCRILIDQSLAPSASDMTTYTIPLASMTLAQPCNGGGFSSGVTTLAQALTHPIGEVHVQAVFPNLNTTIKVGTEYATGFTRGAVWFE